MKPNVQWTDDCQGKKNYDGEVIGISTRYWPRGGGFDIMTIRPGERPQFTESLTRHPNIKPHATSSIILWHDDYDYTELATEDFEGETQKEVQAQVETWAQERFDEIAKLLADHFVKIE